MTGAEVESVKPSLQFSQSVFDFSTKGLCSLRYVRIILILGLILG